MVLNFELAKAYFDPLRSKRSNSLSRAHGIRSDFVSVLVVVGWRLYAYVINMCRSTHDSVARLSRRAAEEIGRFSAQGQRALFFLNLVLKLNLVWYLEFNEE